MAAPGRSIESVVIDRARGGLWKGLAHRQILVLVLSLIVAMLISSGWLVFPYVFEGRGIMSSVGSSVQEGRRTRAIGIGQFLMRVAPGPGEADVDVLYATPKYFEVADKAHAVTEYRPDRYHVFVVNETTHIENLPAELPRATLYVDGRAYAPADVDGPVRVVHHRAVTIRFDVIDAAGEQIIKDGSRRLELRLISGWDEARTPRIATWQLPITYPPEILEGDRWTPVMVLALSAGLLSFVLTPCLLQLIVIYVMTLTALSAEASGGSGFTPAAARRKMVLVALSFVVGFSTLFTAAGAGVGYAGKEIQMFFAEWSRAVSIVAGLLVIALGIWIGIRSRAPLVCRIVGSDIIARLDRRGVAGSALMAAGFTLGCMTCFGGAIIATLLIYVGTLGSPLIGAVVMFTFSLGVAIPFFLAALFLSRIMPLMTRLTEYAPTLGAISMTVIVAFGAVLVTDNFHVFSSFLYPFLGLS